MAIVGGLTLLVPGLMTDIIGLVLVGGSVLWQRTMAMREKAAV